MSKSTVYPLLPPTPQVKSQVYSTGQIFAILDWRNCRYMAFLCDWHDFYTLKMWWKGEASKWRQWYLLDAWLDCPQSGSQTVRTGFESGSDQKFKVWFANPSDLNPIEGFVFMDWWNLDHRFWTSNLVVNHVTPRWSPVHAQPFTVSPSTFQWLFIHRPNTTSLTPPTITSCQIYDTVSWSLLRYVLLPLLVSHILIPCARHCGTSACCHVTTSFISLSSLVPPCPTTRWWHPPSLLSPHQSWASSSTPLSSTLFTGSYSCCATVSNDEMMAPTFCCFCYITMMSRAAMPPSPSTPSSLLVSANRRQADMPGCALLPCQLVNTCRNSRTPTVPHFCHVTMMTTDDKQTCWDVLHYPCQQATYHLSLWPYWWWWAGQPFLHVCQPMTTRHTVPPSILCLTTLNQPTAATHSSAHWCGVQRQWLRFRWGGLNDYERIARVGYTVLQVSNDVSTSSWNSPGVFIESRKTHQPANVQNLIKVVWGKYIYHQTEVQIKVWRLPGLDLQVLVKSGWTRTGLDRGQSSNQFGLRPIQAGLESSKMGSIIFYTFSTIGMTPTLANFVFLSSATSDAVQVYEADWSWLKNKSISVQLLKLTEVHKICWCRWPRSVKKWLRYHYISVEYWQNNYLRLCWPYLIHFLIILSDLWCVFGAFHLGLSMFLMYAVQNQFELVSCSS